jgi:hypothetical protein
MRLRLALMFAYSPCFFVFAIITLM